MAGAALMWRNLVTFSLVLDESTAAALERSTIVLALTATLCLVLARLRSRERRRPLGVGVPARPDRRRVRRGAARLRGPGRPPVLEARPIEAPLDIAPVERTARVTVIALDAASLDLITGATAEGRLPNFGRILDAGAVRHLATLHPDVGRGGVGGGRDREAAAEERRPLGGDLRALRRRRSGATAAGLLLRARAGALRLSRRAAAHVGDVPDADAVEHPQRDGFSVGVVGWPLTQPAPVVRGYLVSDTYHRVALTPSGIDDPSSVYPPELRPDALAAMESGGADAPPVVTASLVDEGGYADAGTNRSHLRSHRADAGARRGRRR